MKKCCELPCFAWRRWEKIIRVMKLTMTLFLFAVLAATAGTTYSQTVRLNLKMKDASLVDVFREIERTSEFGFFFKSEELDLNKRVSIDMKDASIEEILKKILIDNYDYRILDKNIVVTRGSLNTSEQQQKSVSGKVTDSSGAPLPGVTVVVKGTTNGTITDSNGNYSLSNIPGNATLQFSFVGMKMQELAVGNQTTVNVTLAEDAIGIEEVVAVGYGTQKKTNLTGAVDNVSSKTLEALKVNTMGEALQGQISNLNISIADGKPGRAADFNIRGITSINGGSPLIVIDGVPQSIEAINNISPQDVEEISVLKDAASSAIYGARAAYGVILITTKKAKQGELSVQYSNSFGFSKATWIPDVYGNPEDYLEIQNEFNLNIGQTYNTAAQLEYPHLVAKDPSLPHAKVEIIGGRSTLLLGGEVHNYYKEWFNTYSPKQNHHLSLKGGSEKFQYYISGDFNYEEGALKFKPEKINRYTLRSNLTYKINDHISIYNNTALLRRDESLPNTYLYGFCSNVWRFIENTDPLMPENVLINGTMVPTDIGFYRQFIEKQSDINNQKQDVLTTLGIDMSFFKNSLKIHGDMTYQFDNTNKLRWWDNTGPYLSHSFNNTNIILPVYSDAGPANVTRSMANLKNSNINTYITYDKTLGKNYIKLLGGFAQEKRDYFYMYAEHQQPLTGIPQHSINLATGAYSASESDDRNSSRSTFVRLNYIFDEKYLLEINSCYNLSSKFIRENRGAFFGSISGGWRISEESFFKPLKGFINNFKLRGSYGSLGNQNIGSYDYLPIMSVSQSSFLLEGSKINYTSNPTPISSNFTWETSKTIDFGVDISILDNRFVGVFDVYQRNTNNMLAPFHSLPSVYGAKVPKENIASLRNRGWELSLNWNDRFKINNDDFNYGVRLSLSDYSAVITDYYNPTNYLGDYYVGQKLGEIWGLTTLGYFLTDAEAKSSPILITNAYKPYVAAGSIKFDDVNKDGVISKGNNTLDNPGDYKIIGNTTPRYQYGITLNAGWKGLDINAFFRGIGKMDIYPSGESVNFWSSYNRKYQLLLDHVVNNRWSPENPDAYFPRSQGYIARYVENDLGAPQTKYLQSASFIRLKNLTIGYTIPRSIVRKIKVDNIRFYVSGQNLFEFTKLNDSLDPEGLQKDPDASQADVGMGTSYPVQRVYTFGVELRF
jgi:TonB-linked SusC/RagA family outer membrane protein